MNTKIETQIFDRSHLKVNEATQTEIIKRFNNHENMLRLLKEARLVIDSIDRDLYPNEVNTILCIDEQIAKLTAFHIL